jgi:hypothetical protein
MSQIYDRIEKSLKDAIQFHNEGLSATEAVVKSASTHELNPETICRVVEAFNIAKTRAYIKKASVKDGDFDTASKEEAVKKVFGEQKVAAVSQPVASSFLFKKAEDEPFLKEAEEKFEINSGLKRASLSLEEEKRDMEEMRGDIAYVTSSFEKGLSKWAELTSYRHVQEELEDVLDKIAFEYSESENAQKLITALCKIAGIEYQIPQQLVPCQIEGGGLYDIFDGLVDDADEYEGRVREYNKKAEEINNSVSEVESITKSHVNKSVGIREYTKAASLLVNSPKPIKKVIFEKRAESIFSLFEREAPSETRVEAQKTAASFLKKAEAASVPVGLGSMSLGKIPLFDVADSGGGARDLADAGYKLRLMGDRGSVEKSVIDAEMENVQREALIRDFLVNDEIISTYDPKEVIASYNTISQLAPKASLIPDVARASLRYSTAQPIDPHFANQLVELENNLGKTNSPKQEGQKR